MHTTSRSQAHRPARRPAPRRSHRRLAPVAAFAVVAFVIGAIIGSGHGASAEQQLASRFVGDWSHRDYAAMYGLIDPASRAGISPSALAEIYDQALRTATATSARVSGRAHRERDGSISVPVTVHTRLFGTLQLAFRVPISVGQHSAVRWSSSLEFPGLREGEHLRRQSVMPPRASLLARDGSVLASGSGEQRTIASSSEAVVGHVGPVPADRLAQLEELGVPADAQVGISGLELALDSSLRGTPGGTLLAGSRSLAHASPRSDPSVRTTISPSLQQVAVSALGGAYGGVVALSPATGEVLAVAGIGLDGLQPPGSTFKMVTVTGALQAGVAHTSSVFAYETYATLDGVRLSNANGESCGGSLTLAFAVSCNSVFAPLWVKLGASRLVSTAEAFGFNHDLGVAGAPQSTIPQASEIQGELDLGSTAIGQGQVQASPLQMATVATTIADGGRRPRLTFLAARHSHSGGSVRVMSATVARTVRRLMIDVVREGTGTSAAIPGVVVAGKTGTAELGSPRCSSSGGGEAESEEAGEEAGLSAEGCSPHTPNPENTDAWFAAFAPALHPRIAVCVLLVRDGAGGDTAAPVARQVLASALQSGI